jgi:predicted amidohydrolase
LNERTISTIALRDGEYDNLSQTLNDAARLVELAASQGAELVVFPETINLLHRHESAAPLEQFALGDWQKITEQLRERAARSHVAMVLPLLVAEEQSLANCFYFLDRDGSVIGTYQKRVPAEGEVAAGVVAAESAPIRWNGLSMGGAICVDLYYPQAVFEPQVNAGVDCFLIPSMTPGGSLLEAYAITYGVPFVLAYSPWSRILDRDGYELAAGGYRSETLRAGFGLPIQQATINFDAVTLFADHNQEKVQELLLHYGSKVRIRFNQPNCTFMLESRSPDLTVAEIMREFDLISRRDYFARHAPCPLATASDSHRH